MAYYVHNKYDKASVDGLTTIGAGQTLVDYYTDYETYKYLDTSAGFGKVYDTLEYVTPNGTTGGGTGDTDGSHFNFSSSIVIKSIQRGTGTGAKTIQISEVDASKTFVFVVGPSIVLGTVSNTNFKTTGSGNFGWQVIEFM